ncbi:MAG: cysteine-rich CWC family protein [Planctomycetaceae bacterium]|nr:cysteine-rich CWC family protein [Planctomycetaceae bacterium]
MSDAQRPDPDGTSDCSQCGGRFACGFAAGQSRCWCFDYPVVAVHDEAAGCVCPMCLAARVAQC